jgi:hypothetical protein
MKKRVALFSILSLVVGSGCSSPTDQLCLTQAECAGEEDPAGFCQKQKDGLNDDEQKAFDACQAESDAFATCALERGECKAESFQVDGAPPAGDVCGEEFGAFFLCLSDNS